jgi:dihydrodipicolinate synthase/N-acetylneuraminate lyase
MLTLTEARQRWQGVVVPLVSIFDSNGALDLPATADHARWIISRGARIGNTIFLAGGSGGDFSVMNLDERKRVIAAIAEAAKGQIPIIAGVQATDIRECIELCQHCEAVGIDAVQISGPYYYDGRPGDVSAWLQAIARQTKIAFALYNNWYTGYNMPFELIDQLLEIPNCVGLKWSHPNVQSFYDGVRRFVPRVVVVDNTLHPIMPHILGCRAWVSHVPNFAPQHSWRVWELMEAGQHAEAQRVYDELMVPYSVLVGQIQQVTAGEAVFVRVAMRAFGRPAGYSRLPSRDDVVSPQILQGFRSLAGSRADGHMVTDSRSA